LLIAGRALLTLENPDDRDSFDLQSGDAQRIPSGTTFYLVNLDNKETLRVMALVRPVNNPSRFEVLLFLYNELFS